MVWEPPPPREVEAWPGRPSHERKVEDERTGAKRGSGEGDPA